jgi:hypothetical protein
MSQNDCAAADDSANSSSSLMIFAHLGKFVRLSWRKLLVAMALTPLMGFSLGAYVAVEKPEKPEAAVAAADVQRGRLLYETYCIACHTTQAHWRDKHIVASWADLLYQVTRMQKNAGQDWSSAEVSDVAAYLNELFYKMPCPSPGCREPQASTMSERLSLQSGCRFSTAEFCKVGTNSR